MGKPKKRECARCEVLERQLEALQREMEELRQLKDRLAELEAELAKARKNSSNSSKPPSSDIAKPPRMTSAPSGKKRKQGAQPGHPRRQREPFPEGDVDDFYQYYYDLCPCCGEPVTVDWSHVRTMQQVEIVAAPIRISEHRSCGCHCARCDKTHFPPIDEEARHAGLVGPRLTALIAYLKGACHCSFSTIRKFLRDVVGVQISRGQLRKVCDKVSRSLEGPYDELLQLLPQAAVLNVDETGHKDKGQAMWTWCFRAAAFTLFKIDPSRSSQVLLDVLGEEFDGVLGCDYFSAYRKYMRLADHVTVQFCLAHLIRDIKFLVQHPDSRNRAYGRRVLRAAQELFSVIHRREEMSAEQFALELEDAGHELQGQAIYRVPRVPEAENLAHRFWKHGQSYLQFITTPGVEPTNNLAEQAIRFVVIDRKVTQGSRSEAGQRWLERIWTTIATCTQQGRSVFEFLCQSMRASFREEPGPSLAPDTS